MIDEELLRTLASTDEPTTIRPLPQIAARAAVLRRRRRGTTAFAALAAGVAALAVVTGPNLTGHHSPATTLNNPAASATATPSASATVPPATRTAAAPPVTPTHRASTSVPATQVHAKFVSLKSGMIAYNDVQWFDGAAAVRECRKEGLKTGGSPLCRDYYYKDASPRVRSLPIAKDAVIKVPGYRVDPKRGSGLTRVTLSQLQEFVAASPGSMDIVLLTIKNGEVTEFNEIFLG
jgi:hypothetical protein